MIEVNRLTKRFGATVALDGITFEVARGEVLGLLGPNGAGKTTAMRVITCYIPADEGSAKVAGHDTATESVAVRQQIGYLPESAPLYEDMGVVDYLRFIGRVRGIDDPRLAGRIEEMVDICGLARMAHRTIGTLSKGYRQRVGLAQTLIHDPQVLILDEPTTGLDPNQIVEIRGLIKRIGQEKTIILSTHILPEVESTCSRVLIIADGRIVASGTPAELVNQAAGDQHVYVTIQGDAARIEPLLRESGLAGDLRLVSAGGGKVRYVMAARGGEPEADLFRLAVRNDWVLTELRRETASLEQVFTQLTTREALNA